MSFDVRKDTLMHALARPAILASAREYKKPLLGIGLTLILLTISVGIAVMAPTTSTIPTISIVDVVEDQTVTVRTANFPATQEFVVTMGPMGTRGINGTVVATTNSGAGGSFDVTYNIPAGLVGSNQIAIRLQSPQGFFAYNWFYNNTTGTVVTPDPDPGSALIPRFHIESVVRNETVAINTENFPANRDFVVRMAPMGTRGINGIVVDTTNSGAGGSFTETYEIPEVLHGQNQIAIRLEATTGGYFAYNWFYNNTYPGSGGDGAGDGTGAGTGGAAYTGIPTFSIESVAANESVTIRTNNFPRNREFVVTMGAMGTKGINGIPVATTDSGAGGVFTSTYQIPEALQSSARIAIRLESTSGGFFAYNWFYNNTIGDGTGDGGTGDGDVVTPPPPPADDDGYTGFPWFEIASVQEDQSVTVNAYNLPPNQQFIVTMGPIGTEGINGIPVATTDSGAGGDLTATYQIPEALRGLPRIALRLESAQGYHAYNWFYNNTTN